MIIVVDESVSFGVVSYLRNMGNEVIAITDPSTSGLKDPDVFKIVKREKAILITRDNHFTNNIRFPSKETTCIIYIRKGDLTSNEEIELIKWFFNTFSIEDFKGHLVSISKDQVKVR